MATDERDRGRRDGHGTSAPCRVCGYRPEGRPPWGYDGASPVFDVCPSCGVGWGYQDTTSGDVARYRREWLELYGPRYDQMISPIPVLARLDDVPAAFRKPWVDRPIDVMFCRVCGLCYDDPPWGWFGDLPSFDICLCCGTTFGYQDGVRAAILDRRRRWLRSGAHWSWPAARPPDWDLDAQLMQIPEAFKDDAAP